MNKLFITVITLMLLQGVAGADIPDFSQAKWIGFQQEMRDQYYAVRTIQRKNDKKPIPIQVYPSTLMRKQFAVHKPVKSVKANICGLGVHELYINGVKVGDHVLSPAITTYDKRAYYIEHDVTSMLKEGTNALVQSSNAELLCGSIS